MAMMRQRRIMAVVAVAVLMVVSCVCAAVQVKASGDGSSKQKVHPHGIDSECMWLDIPCAEDDDDHAFEALSAVLEVIDDNHDGVIDLTESHDFFEELDDEAHVEDDVDENEEDEVKKRQNEIHQRAEQLQHNDHGEDTKDHTVTASELLESWRANRASYWTSAEVQAWIVAKCELPELVPVFARAHVTGRDLPFVLARSMHSNDYLRKEYGMTKHVDRIKLITELSLLVLQPEEMGHWWTTFIVVCGITIPVVLAAAAYSKVVSDQSQARVKTMQKFVNEQDAALKDLEQRVCKSETRKNDALKRMRSMERHMSSQSMSKEVYDLLQQWRDNEEDAALKILDKSRVHFDELKAKLNKNQSKSIFSARTIKQHMSGQEDVNRNKYRAAAAKFRGDIIAYEDILKKWAYVEEVAGVRFRRTSDGQSDSTSGSGSEIGASAPGVWSELDHPSLEDLSQSS